MLYLRSVRLVVLGVFFCLAAVGCNSTGGAGPGGSGVGGLSGGSSSSGDGPEPLAKVAPAALQVQSSDIDFLVTEQVATRAELDALLNQPL
jgi:hypothetical protein